MAPSVHLQERRGDGDAQLSYVVLSLDDNNSVDVNLFGATITSWKAGGIERIFVSKKAVLDNKKAIRGGVPFVFPNFGPWDLGPQHGFARITQWEFSGQSVTDESASASFTLKDSDTTRKQWNRSFLITYELTLRTGTLLSRVTVENTGVEPFDFTTLLHTYFKTPSQVAKARIGGLTGSDYLDKIEGGEKSETNEWVCISGPVDRVYQATASQHLLAYAADSTAGVAIVKDGFEDTVVWNPWVEGAKKLADMDDDEFHDFVCVEVGTVVRRILLAPGGKWTGSQSLRSQL